MYHHGKVKEMFPNRNLNKPKWAVKNLLLKGSLSKCKKKNKLKVIRKRFTVQEVWSKLYLKVIISSIILENNRLRLRCLITNYIKLIQSTKQYKRAIDFYSKEHQTENNQPWEVIVKERVKARVKVRARAKIKKVTRKTLR